MFLGKDGVCPRRNAKGCFLLQYLIGKHVCDDCDSGWSCGSEAFTTVLFYQMFVGPREVTLSMMILQQQAKEKEAEKLE